MGVSKVSDSDFEAEVLKSAVIFDFVGNVANTIEVSGLRIAGYLPPCR